MNSKLTGELRYKSLLVKFVLLIVSAVSLYACSDQRSGPSNHLLSNACRLAAVATLYDQDKMELYQAYGFFDGKPLIQGARGWIYMCKFEGNRIYITGKHPKNGWRQGNNKWGDNPSMTKLTYESSASKVTVNFTDMTGSVTKLSSSL
jgi:hypothetical protein